VCSVHKRKESVTLGDFTWYSPANSLIQELVSREWFRLCNNTGLLF
jgi:hypothetical protein